jgi:curved DNA-binding protein CbpA
VRKDIIPFYRALGLSPGAEPVEIRRAYRQLIQQWHPDLYKPGSPMQTTAEDITKEINEAYDQLYRKKLYRNFSAKRGRKPEADASRDAEAASPVGDSRDKAAGTKGGRPMKAKPTGPARTRTWMRWPTSRWVGAGAVIALAVILSPLGRIQSDPGVWVALFPSLHGMESETRDTAAGTTPARAAEREPTRAQAGRQAAGLMGPEKARPGVSATRVSGAATPAHSDAAFLMAKAEELLDVIELGDTKARVLAIQGAPDEAGENIFRYGSSVVYFADGRVKSWLDRQPRLHVRDWSARALPTLDTFWRGSSRGEVVRAQGLPSAFDETSYTYGSSVVFFDHGHVAGWSEGDTRLERFEMPSLPFRDLDKMQLLDARAGSEF